MAKNVRSIIVNDFENKERVFDVSPLAKWFYKVPNNSFFEFFYLQDVLASITELGKPAVIYKF